MCTVQGNQAKGASVPRKPAGRAFLRLLGGPEGEVAFEELYVMTFALLDRVFLENKVCRSAV